MDADRAESLAKEVFSAALQAAGADEDVTEYVLSCAASVLEGASARGAVRRDAAAAVRCAMFALPLPRGVPMLTPGRPRALPAAPRTPKWRQQAAAALRSPLRAAARCPGSSLTRRNTL